MQRSEITTGFIDAAIPFMERARDQGKPFYVNLWPDDVHSPFWPSYERIKQTNNKRELYLAVLEEMDAQFGKLFEFIRADDKLRDNTLILVCSDNGPEKGAGRAGPFKGFKTHLYEGGIRSSLVAWAPGLMESASRGKVNEQSVFSAIDLAPSLLSLAGLDSNEDPTRDGEDLADTLLGIATQSRRSPLFFSRPPDRKNFYGFQNLPDLAMRQGKWKLLCDYDGARPELYDLAGDPGESKNVAQAYPRITQQMIKSVVNWHESMPKIKSND